MANPQFHILAEPQSKGFNHGWHGWHGLGFDSVRAAFIREIREISGKDLPKKLGLISRPPAGIVCAPAWESPSSATVES